MHACSWPAGSHVPLVLTKTASCTSLHQRVCRTAAASPCSLSHLTSTILITEALPIRWSATMQSPLLHSFCAFACSTDDCRCTLAAQSLAGSLAACCMAKTLGAGRGLGQGSAALQSSHVGHCACDAGWTCMGAWGRPRLAPPAPCMRVTAAAPLRTGCSASWRTSRMSSVVSASVARAEPSDSIGSRLLVTRHCLAGASPEQDQVRLSVVSTGTATVSTCGDVRLSCAQQSRHPATRRQHVRACSCRHGVRPGEAGQLVTGWV